MNEEEEVVVDAEIKRCPNCGASPKYDITSGNLVCGHCNFTQEIESNDGVQRRQLTDELRRSKPAWTEGRVFRCDGCGAKEVQTGKEITQLCAFCGNKSIISVNELCGVKPDSVIPFKIDIDNAREIFKRWMRGKWLAPRSFKTYDIREHMKALYCPSWSFTTNTQSMYNGTLARRQTVHRRNPNGQMVASSRLVNFNARGTININYVDHLVQSSDRISPATFNQLKPFDLRELRVYRTEFLQGIVTEHYTRELSQCFDEFSNFIRTDLRRRIMQKHMADSVGRLDINTNYLTKEFNYILLPLYIANYKFREKQYNFFINGISGKLVGKYPKSGLKVFLLCAGIGLVVAAAIGIGVFVHISTG